MTGARARCLIVDDEAPAREELRFLLSGFDDVQVVGEATNPEEALELLRSLRYDVVLLDVRMPGGTGLELAAEAARLPHPPTVVFTTAYPDYAVEAFELAAADYLVKPFDAARLRRALDRALAGIDDDEPAHPEPARAAGWGSGGSGAGGLGAGAGIEPLWRVPVQRGDRTVLVDAAEVVYATASRGYTALVLPRERVLVSFSLTDLERRLPGRFFRTHRTSLVNLDRVRELVPDYRGALVLVMDDRQASRVEVSRRRARDLRRRLGLPGANR